MTYKVPVITKEDYIVYTEDVQGLVFIHMDVFRWSKTVKRNFLKDWNEWASAQGKDLYAMPFIDNDKMVKWCTEVCGFRLLHNHLCTDGVVRKLYIWRK